MFDLTEIIPESALADTIDDLPEYEQAPAYRLDDEADDYVPADFRPLDFN